MATLPHVAKYDDVKFKYIFPKLFVLHARRIIIKWWNSKMQYAFRLQCFASSFISLWSVVCASIENHYALSFVLFSFSHFLHGTYAQCFACIFSLKTQLKNIIFHICCFILTKMHNVFVFSFHPHVHLAFMFVFVRAIKFHVNMSNGLMAIHHVLNSIDYISVFCFEW